MAGSAERARRSAPHGGREARSIPGKRLPQPAEASPRNAAAARDSAPANARGGETG